MGSWSRDVRSSSSCSPFYPRLFIRLLLLRSPPHPSPSDSSSRPGRPWTPDSSLKAGSLLADPGPGTNNNKSRRVARRSEPRVPAQARAVVCNQHETGEQEKLFRNTKKRERRERAYSPEIRCQRGKHKNHKTIPARVGKRKEQVKSESLPFMLKLMLPSGKRALFSPTFIRFSFQNCAAVFLPRCITPSSLLSLSMLSP